MSPTLWPEFTVESTPGGIRAVLDEAGEELRRKTDGRVEFRSFLSEVGYGPTDPFTYEGELFVPTLNYKYFLLQIKAGVGGYPVTVAGGGRVYEGVEDDTRLREVLAEVFHSAQVRNVVQNLLTMTA